MSWTRRRDQAHPGAPPIVGPRLPADGRPLFAEPELPGEAEAFEVAAVPAPEQTTQAGGEGDAAGGGEGWPSCAPIVLGTPTLRFEPRSVAAEFRRAPYRPDTLLDGWGTAEFWVRGASVRGYQHRYDGAPRQDDFVIMEREGTRQIIAAVADGVSEATQSHIGSTTAARYACQWLLGSLGNPTETTDWQAMIESTAWALVEQAHLLDDGCSDAAAAEKMLATTLVCAVVDVGIEGGLVAHVVSVGDSGAWCLTWDGYTRVAGGKAVAADGLSSSAVAGLPRVPADVRASRVVLSPGEVLLLGTDGFGDPLGSGVGLVGGLFADILRPGPPTLTEFGHALDFSRDTFDDDRTLVAIWRRPPVPRSGRARVSAS